MHNSDSADAPQDQTRQFASSASIVVVGSINMDLVAKVHRLPQPGETVPGETFQTIPGGKGANQAVAAARLGARVKMIARVGGDAFGATLRQNLIAEGIETASVLESENDPTGVALIGVESSGANAITVVPGANGRLSVDDLNRFESIIAEAGALVVQLETPLATVAAAIDIAHRHNVFTILDPAPAPLHGLPPELLRVDLISPNQSEAAALTGKRVTDWESAKAAALELRRLGAQDIVLKMGELGAFVFSRDGSTMHVPAVKANVVDTTAAGDAFTAALAVALCEGKPLAEAVRWAVIAGTLACLRFGAQPAMPTRSELEQVLEIQR
jgi:ribokinase